MSGIIVTDRRGNEVEERAVSTTNSAVPDQWLTELFGGSTAAGVTVTRSTLVTLGAFWKGLTLISTDIGRTPLNLWKQKGAGKELQYDHDMHYLVRQQPNPEQRAFDYFQQGTFHKLLYGASYSFKVLRGGRVVELLPLLPDSMSIRYEGGRRYYETTLYYDDGTSQQYTLDSSQVKVNTWMSYDGVRGMGILSNARELAARMVAMRAFGSGVFKNSARPSVVIKMQTPFKNEATQERFIQSWQRMYSGTENAHKTAVLPVGAEIDTFGHNAKDSQFIESEQQCWREVANFFCMPASKLNDMSRSAYNSLEQDALAYLSDCLEGHLVAEEQACNESLLTEKERRGGYFFQFDRRALRVADLKTMGEYYSKAMGNNAAFMTPNEVRGEIGLNPLDDGDDLPKFGQQQQAPPMADPVEGTPAVDTEGDGGEDDSDEAMRELLRDAIQRVVTRASNEAQRAFKRGGEAQALGAVDLRACDATIKILGPVIRAARNGQVVGEVAERISIRLSAAVRAAAQGGPNNFEQKLRDSVSDIAEGMAA